MSEKTFHVEIVTPRGQAYSGDATMVALPGAVGPFQVLVDHAPILSQLGVGLIRILDDANKEKKFATSGGFMEMSRNKMSVIAESIEPAEEIDAVRAEASLNRAQERLTLGRQDRTANVDMARAQASLTRAMNRLRIAGRM